MQEKKTVFYSSLGLPLHRGSGLKSLRCQRVLQPLQAFPSAQREGIGIAPDFYIVTTGNVSLCTEGVDCINRGDEHLELIHESPSAQREWIEIVKPYNGIPHQKVSLCTEGVD